MGILTVLERVGRWSLTRAGFTSRFVTTASATIHLYEAPGRGALPPVVLLHGVGSNAVPFNRLLRRLRTHCRRVVAPELPAHGLSPVPGDAPLSPARIYTAIGEVLSEVLDEPAVIVGNSLGGGVALRVAIDHPELVRGLVLFSPAGAPFEPDELSDFLGNFKPQSRAEASAFLRHLYDKTPWYAPLMAADVKATFEQPVLREFFEGIAPDDFATPEQLASITAPVVLLWGEAETLMPAHHLEFFRSHLPVHARIEQPRGFGHSPHIEHPDRVVERILRFMRDDLDAAAGDDDHAQADLDPDGPRDGVRGGEL